MKKRGQVLEKPRPKRQHYVPRFYLEHFCDSNGMVWNYDLQMDSVRPATPQNTAVETNFYSVIDAGGEHNDAIESWLQGVEGKASELYPKVLLGERLHGQEKADFAVFIASLFTRSPAIVTAYAELMGNFAQHLTDSAFKDRARFDAAMDELDAHKGIATDKKERDEAFKFANDKSRYFIEVDKKRGLQVLATTDHLTEIFFDMTWFILESKNQHMITSDNPVVRVNPPSDHHPIYGDGGFLNKRVNVTLPLSSRMILGLGWNEHVRDGIIQVDRERGRQFNRQRAHYSERYLYASQRDGGIQALGKKYRNPGLRIKIMGANKLAQVKVRRNPQKSVPKLA